MTSYQILSYGRRVFDEREHGTYANRAEAEEVCRRQVTDHGRRSAQVARLHPNARVVYVFDHDDLSAWKPVRGERSTGCMNPNGPEITGECNGEAAWQVTYRMPSHPDIITNTAGPMCRAHADFERHILITGKVAMVVTVDLHAVQERADADR